MRAECFDSTSRFAEKYPSATTTTAIAARRDAFDRQNGEATFRAAGSQAPRATSDLSSVSPCEGSPDSSRRTPLDKGRGCGAPWYARPLHLPKPLWHPFIIITCVVDHDRQQKGHVGIHEVTTINRQLPLKTEVPLAAIVRGARDDRQEQGAGLDLLADRGAYTIKR
jgi:hypothetical protein